MGLFSSSTPAPRAANASDNADAIKKATNALLDGNEHWFILNNPGGYDADSSIEFMSRVMVEVVKKLKASDRA